MKNFEHVNATSLPKAITLLDGAQGDGYARPIAGGTDLLSELKLNIGVPQRLVNLKTIAGLDAIHFDEREGLRLGALAHLTTIAEHDLVRTRYPILVEAISQAASPQLRNQGTIAGNLEQHSRCWYYRGPFHCWLKGGEICYAREGENARHAIFGGGPCYMVHPSDPAPALIALAANVRVVGPSGERTLPLEQFYQRPHVDARKLTVLGPGELVAEVQVPTRAAGGQGTYLKAMERKVWAFALASVAVWLAKDGDTIRDAHIVLGGVAPIPWRLPAVESLLKGQRLDDATIERASERAVEGAQPLAHNGYKVVLVRGIVAEALLSLRS